MASGLISQEFRDQAARVVRQIAAGYAVLAAVLLILAFFQSDQTFIYWLLVLSVPIFGVLFTTVGRIDPTLGGASEILANSPVILLNIVWCFAFMWVILRVTLEVILAITASVVDLRSRKIK
ncbi:hypothetical protein [Pseudarthrobacter sp. NamE2]|uniref:hypothetical protein n=1 Tax=Pseudarthrobacter sp. NamE2 TaxID=2576838 RepID=UPI0010FD189C|nr:hypothetical protein [Pseudarthrobacter sp. NamE2]